MPIRPTTATIEARADVLATITRIRVDVPARASVLLTRPPASTSPDFAGPVDAPATADTIVVIVEHAGGALPGVKVTLPEGTGPHRILLHVPDSLVDPARPPGGFMLGGRDFEIGAIDQIATNLVPLAWAVGAHDAGFLVGALAGIDDPAVREVVAGFELSLTPFVELLLEVATRVGEEAYRDTLAAMSEGWPAGTYRTYCTQHTGRPERFVIRHQVAGATTISMHDSVSTVAVPGTGGALVIGFTEANGVPDVVERVALWLHEALEVYAGDPMGLRPPHGPIEVRVSAAEHFAFSRAGLIDLPGRAPADRLSVHTAHELMHRFQGRYEGRGVGGAWAYCIREGGCMLGEDAVADPYNRYIGALAGTYPLPYTLASHPHRSLSSYGYTAAQFFKYVAEQRSTATQPQDEPLIGLETQRHILEAADAYGYERIALERAIAAMPWYQSFDRFARQANSDGVDLLSDETLLGNFRLAAAVVDGSGFTAGETRFELFEAGTAFLEEPVLAPGMPRATSYDAGVVAPGGGVSVGAHMLEPDAARYYRIEIDPAVDTFRLRVGNIGNHDSCLVQAVVVQDDGTVRDIHRSDAPHWIRRFTSPRHGRRISAVLVIVTTRKAARMITVDADAVEDVSEVMITRWNTRMGHHHEVDPKSWRWTWTSPDVWINNGSEADPLPVVTPGADNRLFVRLHNHGLVDAGDVVVRAFHQPATGAPRAGAAWLPIADAYGTTDFGPVTIPAGGTTTVEIPWHVPALGKGDIPHYVLRVRVEAPGDLNEDGKSCLTALGAVTIAAKTAALPLLRHARHDDAVVETFAVERGDGRLLVPPERIAGLSANPPAAGDTPRLDLVPVDLLPAPIEALDLALEYDGGRARPDAGLRNRPDPDTLPPTAARMPLVTIAQTANGAVVGGYTFIVRGAGLVAPRPLASTFEGREAAPAADCEDALQRIVDAHHAAIGDVLSGRPC